MLLRRITKHVKAQNWFAVALDFLIVVIGIFVGLQVNDWNTQRQEKLLLGQYLENMKEDVRIDLTMLQGLKSNNNNRRAGAIAILDAMATGNPGNPGEFFQHITYTLMFRGPVLERTTYEDLVATGTMRLIDAELRAKIINYYRYEQLAADNIELNQNKIWLHNQPVMLTAMPLEAQRWCYGLMSQIIGLNPMQLDAPGWPPNMTAGDIDINNPPAFIPQAASVTLNALTHLESDALQSLETVILSTWSTDRILYIFQTQAEDLINSLP